MNRFGNHLQTFQPILDLMGQLSAERSRIALTIYRGIADRGLVTVSELSNASGQSEAEIVQHLNAMSGIYRDDEENIIGFWGLTAAPVSHHQLILAKKTRYAWCAWDALFLPELLEANLTVQSRCAQTQEPIHLELTPTEIISVSHPDIVVSMLVPDESAFTEDVMGGFCHYVHFFETRAGGQRWIQDKPGIDLLTLQDAHDLGKMKNAYQFNPGASWPA